MVYVLVEIGGHQQLSRLRGLFLSGLVENLNGLVTYFGGERLFSDRGALLYGLAPARTNGEPVGELLYRIHGLLSKSDSELVGFTVLAEELDEGQEGAIMRRLESEAVRWIQGQGLWIGPGIRAQVEAELALRGEGDYREVIGRAVSPPGDSSWPQDFWARPAVVSSIATALAPFLQTPSGPCWIRLYGPPLLGKSHNLDLALAKVCGRQGDWLRLTVEEADLPPIAPFRSALRTELVEQAAIYLTRPELLVWEQRRPIFATVCADHSLSDLFVAFAHYLLAYRRFMERRLLPPVVIFERLDLYHPSAQEVIAKVIRTLAGPAPFVAVGILDHDVVPAALADLPSVDVSIGPMDAAEIGERLSGSASRGEVEELLDRTGGRTLLVHHSLLLADHEEVRGEGISRALLGELDSASRLTLYVLHRSAGILAPAEVLRFLAEQRMAPEVVTSSLGRLRELGFVAEHSQAVETPEAAESLTAEFAPRRIEAKIARWAYELWKRGELQGTVALIVFLGRYGNFDQTIELFFSVATALLDQGEVDEVLTWIEQAELFPGNLSLEEARTRDLFFELLALRAAVLLQEREQAELHITRIKELSPATEWERGLFSLATGQHLYAEGELRPALDAAKHALLASQRIEASFLEYRANLEVGLAMLATARFKEAQEYFAIARDVPEADASGYDLVRSQGFEAVAHFLYGNHSKALRVALEAKATASAVCRREWQRFLILLRGRCLFALGAYQGAGRLFQAGLSFCKVYPNDDAAKVFSAWSARAALYDGSRQALRLFESLEPTPEVLYFMGEACVESNDWERASALLARADELLRGAARRYGPSEIIPWSDGFASIEGRAFGSREGANVLHQQVRATLAYASSRTRPREEASAELVRLTREEKLSDFDPNLSYYYYLHFLVLPEGEGEEAVVRMTLLSKALKGVQEQSTRIDEVKKRESFIQNSRWNARVISDAKRLRLM